MESRSGRGRLPRKQCAPSPARGGGSGRGCLHNATIPQRKEPSPQPSPAGGRGSSSAVLATKWTPKRRAGDSSVSLLHWPREAATRVRSHISPGPYRSFRELSLAGPVGPDIWCPPTFVGNSGIECFNGVRGFALLSAWLSLLKRLRPIQQVSCPPGAQLRAGDGASSTPRPLCETRPPLEYWITRIRGW